MSPSGHRNTLIVISERPEQSVRGALPIARRRRARRQRRRPRLPARGRDPHGRPAQDYERRRPAQSAHRHPGLTTNLDGPCSRGLPTLTSSAPAWAGSPRSPGRMTPYPPPSGYDSAVLSRDFLPIPDLTIQPLAVRIIDPASLPAPDWGTEFRYWVAANALARATTFWRGIEGAGNPWQLPESALPVHLNEGVGSTPATRDAGAGDKPGLDFVSERRRCDILRRRESGRYLSRMWPCGSRRAEARLWDSGFGGRFVSRGIWRSQLHFLCSNLTRAHGPHRHHGRAFVSELPDFTARRTIGLRHSSANPDLVDADCIRNAFNSFIFEDPEKLPGSARLGALARPHSFSRMFTSAIFEVLAGRSARRGRTRPGRTARGDPQVATLLIAALRTAANVPGFFSQLAAEMLTVANARFGAGHAAALRDAFITRRILPDTAFKLSNLSLSSSHLARIKPPQPASDGRLVIDHVAYGLPRPLIAFASDIPATYQVASTATRYAAAPPSREQAANSFVEDLFRRGKVDLRIVLGVDTRMARPTARYTHYLLDSSDGLELRRRFFDCGFGPQVQHSVDYVAGQGRASNEVPRERSRGSDDPAYEQSAATPPGHLAGMRCCR